MLKKGQPVKFSRPMSTMRVVLMAVEQGHQYRHDILREPTPPSRARICPHHKRKSHG